jgi:high affinity sulfate transporter 1
LLGPHLAPADARKLRQGARRSDFRYDLAAGLSVASIAVPVSVAYAALAGFEPVVGLYGSILPLVVYALFGSSRQLIVGPDSATCAMIAVALAPFASGDPDQHLALAVALSAIVGVLYLVASRFRLGALADFLSRPILVGFLAGVSLAIIVSQLDRVTGLSIEATQVLPILLEFFRKIPLVHWPTLEIAIGVYAILEIVPRLFSRIPAALVAMIVAGGAVAVFGLEQRGVAVVGPVPSGLPALHLPLLPLGRIGQLLGAAGAVALVGFTSSIVTVRAFAAKNHYEIDVDRELVALGAAQLAAALSQSFPVTGTDSRTVASDAAGGRTQVTALVAAVAIAVVLLFLTEPIRYVPMAALGAVLIKSAVSLIDLRAFRDILRVDWRELLLALVTVLGVLWFDAIQAVLIAVLLALARFIQIASRPDIELLGEQANVRGFHDLRLYPDAKTPPGVVLFRFNGPLTFFNAGYFRERLLAAADAAGTNLHAVIVDATGFSTRVDATTVFMLVELRHELESRGVALALAGKLHMIEQWLSKHRFESDADRPRLFSTLEDAIDAYRLDR